MAKCYFTQKAVEDLSDIWNYTLQEWSETQADQYYHELISACNLLAKRPKLGQNSDLIRMELFRYHVGRHFIFFHKVSKSDIEIIRILHDSMDFRKHLGS